MNINRVTLCGHTGKDARTSASQNGRNMTKLSVATSKRYKDAAGVWQEKTQWHMCVCYGPTADYAAKIQTGAHVFIEGELVDREYERTIETESGPVKIPCRILQATTVMEETAPFRSMRFAIHPLPRIWLVLSFRTPI
jgi:single-strand DNA-binding protein